MEYKELKIKHLVSLRNNYYTTVVLISTGLLGLFFVDITIAKLIIFFILGLYFDYVFLTKFLLTNNQIINLLKDN